MSRMPHTADPHRADKEVAVPRRKMLARIEGQPGGSDRWPPQDFRAFKLLEPRGLAYRNTRILTAIRSNGPSVICAALDDVCFITTLWPVLCRPEIAGLGVKTQTDLVAVT